MPDHDPNGQAWENLRVPAVEMVDSLGLPFASWLLTKAKAEDFCPLCEGDGSYSKLADCTTVGAGCACNGPRITVDPCGLCGGSGSWPHA